MKPCCKTPANRKLFEKTAQGLETYRCVKCGCKHYEMNVDPVKFFTKLPTGDKNANNR